MRNRLKTKLHWSLTHWVICDEDGKQRDRAWLFYRGRTVVALVGVNRAMKRMLESQTRDYHQEFRRLNEENRRLRHELDALRIDRAAR